MPQDLTDDTSTLVQVMAWCRQTSSQYLNQCWPRFPTQYGVIRPQLVKLIQAKSLRYPVLEWIAETWLNATVPKVQLLAEMSISVSAERFTVIGGGQTLEIACTCSWRMLFHGYRYPNAFLSFSLSLSLYIYMMFLFGFPWLPWLKHYSCQS